MAGEGIEATAAGRAAALLGRPVGEVEATPADRRSAAGVLHDLIVWGLDQGLPDDALRPVEARLGELAGELLPDDPALAALLDWWLTAVVGLPPQQLWFASGGQPGSPTQPLPPELTDAILPGGRPPNLGAEIKTRRFTEDRERLRNLVTTVPALSQVAKAQSVVKALNGELAGFLSALDAARQPDTPAPEADGLVERADGLADRADALLRTSGVVEGTPLYGKVRRELDERVALAQAVAARAGNVGPALEPLPAARVKALTRLAGTGDQVLAGRLLSALGGPQPRPEPSGLAVVLAEAMDALDADDRFRAHHLLGAVAEPVANAAEDPQLAGFLEEGRQVRAEALATLEDLEPHAAGDAADLPGLVRSALDAGDLAEARTWLTDLQAAVAAVRARKEANRALDRARNRGVEGWLVDALAAAVEAGDTTAMATLAAEVRLLPGMERKVSALAEQAVAAPPAAAGEGAAGGPVSLAVSAPPGSTVKRGWPERLERPAVIKPVAAYVIRVNAHNRFFDGRICAAPAGNRQCASSERFKLDFCEKGVRRCSWLAAFAEQPRVELTDPFVDEYQPVIDEMPPEAGDVAVLWASTDSGNEVVGLWRVLTLAKARRGWVLNGDRDAAVLLPKGVVPWSAVYRRWSSPRGSMALRTLDTAGLEGLLVEVRDALAPLADADPQVQRDLAALEVMLADQRGRVPPAPKPDAQAPRPEARPKGKKADKNGEASVAAPPRTTLEQRLRARGGFYAPALVAQYELAVRESRLVVLAGPSGTGKTRLALEAAAELGAVSCLVAVRPDWHANEDLLGYLPPFPGSRFSSTAASEFIRSAGIEAEAAAAEQRSPRPFHLCLDEMNLARPEHYLAELLSKMEVPGGRVTFHTGGSEAGFPPEVAYPPNLVIIGTVNLDETTLPISAKILDRAAYLVVEAHDLRGFLETLAEVATVPAWIPKLLVDLDGSLDDAGQGLGYRVAQRLLRWASLGAAEGHSPEEALDWAFAAQVVPRLRFTRSDPSHLEVLEAIIGRLRGAKGEFHRSTALLDRMLAELRRQDFTLGQMRLS
ncbi:MAG: AAA family ATPase [Actinomycetota bacterium]